MQNLFRKLVKMFHRTTVFPILFLGYVFHTASAEDIKNLSFSHLYIEDGLSQSTILSIYQTTDHFLWLGTIDGLNRYDGYTIKIFSNSDQDTSSLSDNYITSLVEDKRGYLWIGTKNNGFNRYESRSSVFKRFIPDGDGNNSPASKNVWDICIDYDGSLWIAYNGQGVDHFYPDSGLFDNYRVDGNIMGRLPSNNVDRIFLDRTNTLWLATQNGLARYNRKEDRFILFPFGESSDLDVKTISQSRRGDIWFSTEQGNLYRIRVDTQEIKKYRLPVNSRLCSIRSILFHPYTNQVLVGTYGFGLFLLNPQEETFTQYVHDAREPTSLSNNYIIDMHIDKSNVLWIGTLKGVNKCDLKPGKFSLFRLKKESRKIVKTDVSPFDNFITTVYKDPQNNVWFGLYGNGLVQLNRQSGQIKEYRFSKGIATIWDIIPDEKSYLWLACDEGLVHFQKKSGKYIKATFPNNLWLDEKRPSLRCLLKEPAGTLLLGFADGTLLRYSPQKDAFTPLSDKANFRLEKGIFNIFRDRRGTIWIGTDGGGLYSYDSSADTIESFFAGIDSLRWIQRVNAVREDHYGNLWVATSKGLAIVNLKTKKVRRFSTENGLPNNFIYAIEHGREDEFWISSNRGITSLRGTLQKGFTILSFSQDDGLQSEEFNTNSSFRAEDGELFFGGINGLNYFYPQNIHLNTFRPSVAITRFEIMLKEQKLNPVGQSFELPHNYNFFRFEFAALDYTNPRKNRYKYIMEGFDNDWIDAGHRRFATYTNLPPGQYTFRVYGTNNDGVWNEEDTWVKLDISSPYWKTPLAYIIYLYILIISVFLIISRRSHKLEKINRLLEQRVEEKTKEVREGYRRLRESQDQLIESAKMRAIGTMASGIVHDFNNLLSIILGSVQLVIQKNRDRALDKHLEYIQAAATDGAKIIQKIQDFSRGSSKETTSLIDINQMLKNVVEITRFKWISQKRMQGISIDFALDLVQNVKVRANRSEIRLAFTNIIINAIESFTTSGKIYITTKVIKNQWIEVSVKDEGRGIDKQTISRIFEPFYSTKGSEGNGLGLTQVYGIVSRSNGSIEVKSKPDKGTEVLIRLPISSDNDKGTNEVDSEIIEVKDEKRLLIIEDELTIREIYEGILRPKGYNLVMTESGEEGLELFTKGKFDLIICDLGLPGMNGWEFIAKVRQNNNHIPILVITGWATADNKYKKKELNIQKILAKPVSVEDLTRNISAFLS